MDVRKELDLNNPPSLTEEQMKMLSELEKAPFVYDEENPPLSDEQLSKFKRVSE